MSRDLEIDAAVREGLRRAQAECFFDFARAWPPERYAAETLGLLEGGFETTALGHIRAAWREQHL